MWHIVKSLIVPYLVFFHAQQVAIKRFVSLRVKTPGRNLLQKIWAYSGVFNSAFERFYGAGVSPTPGVREAPDGRFLMKIIGLGLAPDPVWAPSSLSHPVASWRGDRQQFIANEESIVLSASSADDDEHERLPLNKTPNGRTGHLFVCFCF
jgi:hypothetical protein